MSPAHAEGDPVVSPSRGTELLVVANFGADELALDDRQIPGLGGWQASDLLLGNLSDDVAPTAPQRAWEARILKR